jgi:hypothetical protein
VRRNNYSEVWKDFFWIFFLEDRTLAAARFFWAAFETENCNAARYPLYAARFPLRANFTVLVAIEISQKVLRPISTAPEPSRRSEADGGQRIAGSRQRCGCFCC